MALYPVYPGTLVPGYRVPGVTKKEGVPDLSPESLFPGPSLLFLVKF